MSMPRKRTFRNRTSVTSGLLVAWSGVGDAAAVGKCVVGHDGATLPRSAVGKMRGWGGWRGGQGGEKEQGWRPRRRRSGFRRARSTERGARRERGRIGAEGNASTG